MSRSDSAGLRQGTGVPGRSGVRGRGWFRRVGEHRCEGDAVAPIHVAFQAADNDAVKAFYEPALPTAAPTQRRTRPAPELRPDLLCRFRA